MPIRKHIHPNTAAMKQVVYEVYCPKCMMRELYNENDRAEWFDFEHKQWHKTGLHSLRPPLY